MFSNLSLHEIQKFESRSSILFLCFAIMITFIATSFQIYPQIVILLNVQNFSLSVSSLLSFSARKKLSICDNFWPPVSPLGLYSLLSEQSFKYLSFYLKSRCRVLVNQCKFLKVNYASLLPSIESFIISFHSDET